jgi:hypothetical protein
LKILFGAGSAGDFKVLEIARRKISIVKGNINFQFYFRVREDGKERYTLLRDLQGKPVTTRPKAEDAAALIVPILQAKSWEDIAEYVLGSRQLNSPLAIPLSEIWETFLSQISRPDTGKATLIF